MNRKLLLRLVMDFAAFALLLVALAYYWLDNATHEVVGTGLFALLVAHNTLNRRWYRGLPKPQGPRSAVDKVLVLCLLAAMATLLVTSVMISQTVFAPLASAQAFTARRIHVLAAYWAFLLVAVHLGIRWHLVLGLVRSVVGPQDGGVQTALIRLCAAAIAVAGAYSSFEIGVGGKLLARVSLDGWDFAESTWEFFLHHGAIVGLYACFAYYAFHLTRPLRRASAQ